MKIYCFRRDCLSVITPFLCKIKLEHLLHHFATMDRFVTREKRQKSSDEFEASLKSSPPSVKLSPRKRLRIRSLEEKSDEKSPKTSKIAPPGKDDKKTFQIFIKLPDKVDECATGLSSKQQSKPKAKESESENHQQDTPLKIKMKHIKSENLNCDYCQLYKRSEADDLLRRCESELEYNSGKLAQIQIFGKWIDIPRKQVNQVFCSSLEVFFYQPHSIAKQGNNLMH